MVIAITYKALYRVYRPQTFAEVIGQEAVTRTLRQAIKEQRISHAYLFNGPRGTGKTSSAKIFAKAVNCLDPVDGEPCNKCSACQSVLNGEALDIMEIDAASNRGVDEIRDIRDKVHLSPNSLRYKVYIIDEVHMLTTEAFNALLKTLEEPPSHVIFILATTEPHKLPLTIISRCQRFDFQKIPQNSLIELMRNVCDQQGITITDEALTLIARYAEGGGRDALSVLDQAYSYSGEHITADAIHLITGTLSNDFLHELMTHIKEHRHKDVIALCHRIFQAGKDPEQVLRSVIQYMRDLLVYQNAPDLDEMQEMAKNAPQFVQLSKEIPGEWLFQWIEHLNRTYNELKYSAHPRILFEVSMIQLMEVKGLQRQQTQGTAMNVDEWQKLQDRIRMLEKRILDLEKGNVQPVTAPNANEQLGKSEQKRISTSSDLSFTKLKSMYERKKENHLKRMVELWPQVLEGVRIQDVRTAAWLRQGKPVLATESEVLLAFNSAIHRESTEQANNKKIIESTLFDLTGIRFEIVTIMLSQWEEFQKNDLPQPTEHKEEGVDPLIAQAIQLVGEELVKIKK